MAADDVDGQNAAAVFRWRWVDAARYVVALAMTALMVTVIAHAVHVLLRPDDFVLRVDKGFIAVKRGTPACNLRFDLTLEFSNPSGRAVIYYEHIKVYLFGRVNNMSPTIHFVSIPVEKGIFLKQRSFDLKYLQPCRNLRLPDYEPYFDLFNSSGNKGIPDRVVVVKGILTVGLHSWGNQTSKNATYYCSPVAIGGDSSDNTAGGTQCTENPLPGATPHGS